MRRVRAFLLSVTIACLAGGCGPNQEQMELTVYVNTLLPGFRALERDIIREYENVSGERYEDDAALFDALRLMVVPELTKLISIAKDSVFASDPLRHLHAGYVAVLEKHLAAFQLYVASLDQQDADGQQRAIDQLREAKELMGAFERRLKEFCVERGVTMPPPAQSP
jgi:hypothetical protein